MASCDIVRRNHGGAAIKLVFCFSLSLAVVAAAAVAANAQGYFTTRQISAPRGVVIEAGTVEIRRNVLSENIDNALKQGKISLMQARELLRSLNTAAQSQELSLVQTRFNAYLQPDAATMSDRQFETKLSSLGNRIDNGQSDGRLSRQQANLLTDEHLSIARAYIERRSAGLPAGAPLCRRLSILEAVVTTNLQIASERPWWWY